MRERARGEARAPAKGSQGPKGFLRSLLRGGQPERGGPKSQKMAPPRTHPCQPPRGPTARDRPGLDGRPRPAQDDAPLPSPCPLGIRPERRYHTSMHTNRNEAPYPDAIVAAVAGMGPAELGRLAAAVGRRRARSSRRAGSQSAALAGAGSCSSRCAATRGRAPSAGRTGTSSTARQAGSARSTSARTWGPG